MILPIVVEHLPRALPRRAAGAEGRRARARHDALGDGARRRLSVRARRHRRRDDPRPRPRGRRGDRRHAGDRRARRPSARTSSRPATRSRARSPRPTRASDATARSRRSSTSRLILLVFSLVDEPARAVDRAPRRATPGVVGARERCRPRSVPQRAARQAAAAARRQPRDGARRLARGRARDRASSAIVVWSVARRGASALNLDLLTKTPVQFASPDVKQGLANAFVGTLVIVGARHRDGAARSGSSSRST